MEFFSTPNFDFLSKKVLWIGISAVFIAAGIVSMATRGIPLGIDFRGGADVQLKFHERPDVESLRASLRAGGFGTVTIQRFGAIEDNEVLIRLDPGATGEGDVGKEQEDIATDILNVLRTDEEKSAAAGRMDLNVAGEEDVQKALEAALGAGREDEARRAAMGITKARNNRDGILPDMEFVKGLPEVGTDVARWLDSSAVVGRFAIRSVDYVGPAVGSDLRAKARWAVLMSLGAMLIYIGFRFHAAAYGIAAIIALTHDVLITLGFISFFQKEFDLTVLAAVLTIVGYSVNDTIIIFDRVRDNLRLQRRADMQKVFNDSVNQCLSRTIITSGVVFLVVLCIWLFGGSRLEPFSFALLVGVITGTYSSIYVAAPIVILWTQLVQRKAPRKAA